MTTRIGRLWSLVHEPRWLSAGHAAAYVLVAVAGLFVLLLPAR